ncbi:MAG: response regulator [Firmicutes bacterium]|nr:response regulator [Bacillota bacterium]
MRTQIRVVVVDDAEQTRQSIKAMLETEPWISVVGEAGDGLEALRVANDVKPDLVLMDINLPRMDGIRATSEMLKSCSTSVVVISVEGDKEYFRKAMQAGARDYLMKPFTTGELVQAVRNASAGAEPAGHFSAGTGPALLTVFSTKGGVGKTTVATNLAVALARSSQAEVAVVDLDLEFGCQAVMFGIRPHASIVNLCQTTGEIRRETVDRVLARVPNVPNLFVLSAPPLPEQAALVDGDSRKVPERNYVGEILDLVRSRFAYVVVDTPSSFREATLVALEKSDCVLLVTTPDIPSLQNTAKCLDTLVEKLEFPREKIQLVLNRSGGSAAIPAEDVSRSLDFPVAFHIPSDGQTAVWAANCGQPFTARRTKAPIAACFTTMAGALMKAGDASPASTDAPPIPVVAPVREGRRGFFGMGSGSFR